MNRSKTSPTFLLIMLCLALIAGACSSSTSKNKAAKSEKTGGSECAPRKGEATPKALLRCADRSVAFIETAYGTGTGVAVRHGDLNYVVTNLHVVYPFSAADVTINGDDLGRLAVVGADVTADIALLGPVPDGAGVKPIPLGDPKVEKGDDVFLVGFPGSADAEDADLTITSGLASRTRNASDWDQNYFQSDAVIASGQSGGALFVGSGELAGISGLSYDEGFSLSLSIQDVERAIERIAGGDGDDVVSVPLGADDDESLTPPGGAKEGKLPIPDDIETPTLFLPPSEKDREWNLSLLGPEGQFAVSAVDGVTGEPLLANAAGIALTNEIIESQAERLGVEPTELVGGPLPTVTPQVAARETAPGSFSLTVPAGVAVEVIASMGPDAVPADVSWTSNLSLWPLTEEVETQLLELGTPVVGTVSGYRVGIPFQVELKAGQRVKLLAGSPQGDVALAITGPGRNLTSFDLNAEGTDDQVKVFDDSDLGLFGLDVSESFTATDAGLYNLALQNNEMSPVTFRIEVSAP